MIKAVLSFLILAAIVGTVVLGIKGCVDNTETVCTDTAQITEIGGCDRWNCAVRYSDGTRGDRQRPLVGDIVCRNWVTRDKRDAK